MGQRILLQNSRELNGKEGAKKTINEYVKNSDDIKTNDIILCKYFEVQNDVLLPICHYIVAIVHISSRQTGYLKTITYLANESDIPEFDAIELVTEYYPDGKTFLEDWDISDEDKRINPNQYEFVKEIDMSKSNIFLFNNESGVEYKIFDMANTISKVAFKKTCKFENGVSQEVYVLYTYDTTTKKATYHSYYRTEYGIPKFLKKVFVGDDAVSADKFKFWERVHNAKKNKQLSVDFATWQKPYIHFGDVALLTSRLATLQHLTRFGDHGNWQHQDFIQTAPLFEIPFTFFSQAPDSLILRIKYQDLLSTKYVVIYNNFGYLTIQNEQGQGINPMKVSPFFLETYRFGVIEGESYAEIVLKVKNLDKHGLDKLKATTHVFIGIPLDTEKVGRVLHNKKIATNYLTPSIGLDRTIIKTSSTDWFSVKKDSLLINPYVAQPKKFETLPTFFQKLKYHNAVIPFTLLDLAKMIQNEEVAVYFKHQKGALQMRRSSKGGEYPDATNRLNSTTIWTRVCFNKHGFPKSTLKVEHNGKLKEITFDQHKADMYPNAYLSEMDFVGQGLKMSNEFLRTILHSFYTKMFKGLKIFEAGDYYIGGKDMGSYANINEQNFIPSKLKYVDIIIAVSYTPQRHSGYNHLFKTSESSTCYKFRLHITNEIRNDLNTCLQHVQEEGLDTKITELGKRSEATTMFAKEMVELMIENPRSYALKFVEEVKHPNKQCLV